MQLSELTEEDKENSMHIIKSIRDKIREYSHIEDFEVLKDRVVTDFIQELKQDE